MRDDKVSRAENPNSALQCESLLLRLGDAAVMLAVSPRKLWELTNSGEVPTIRIGRYLPYSRAAFRSGLSAITKVDLDDRSDPLILQSYGP
jgi:hypothetical protein